MADAKVLLCAEDLEKGAVRDSKSTRRARLCLARRDQFSSIWWPKSGSKI